MSWMDHHWQKITPLALLLYPLALVFRLAVALRRRLYAAHLLPRARLPVPVVVIGNISVGGTGKTPLVLWTIGFLRSHGLNPGIVSRGYGRPTSTPEAARADSDPAALGDEPVMLAQRCDVPVWVGRDRIAAARALLAAHPHCDVIVCDDGLQHYRLEREVEVAVIDGERMFGNGWLLPAGPLREPRSRLAAVDAIVVNGAAAAETLLFGPPAFTMALHGGNFRNVLNPEHAVGAEHFVGKTVHAIAGIGNPARFFAQLQRLGVDFAARAFPDHHLYTRADLEPFRHGELVMTEKDAVKCRGFATECWWALVVDAEIDPAFGEVLLRRIGRQA
jgi:tetraacyldisaccharide 4'-kinase